MKRPIRPFFSSLSAWLINLLLFLFVSVLGVLTSWGFPLNLPGFGQVLKHPVGSRIVDEHEHKSWERVGKKEVRYQQSDDNTFFLFRFDRKSKLLFCKLRVTVLEG